MKRLSFFLLIIFLGAVAFSQNNQEKKMLFTSSSEKAKTLFNSAMLAYQDVYLANFIKLTLNALKEDPDFFMANYQLAIYYIYFNNVAKSKQYGNSAINCKAKLSEGELLLKQAVTKLLENRNADVTGFAKKLIELYPKDINTYYQLLMFQGITNDSKGMITTVSNALKITDKPAPLYNMLGYANLNLAKYDDARIAFDKYIELAPSIPNPYDSKGDYYMKVKDYRNAYMAFMKAHEIDSLWGFKKAMKAKAIADSLEKK